MSNVYIERTIGTHAVADIISSEAARANYIVI